MPGLCVCGDMRARRPRSSAGLSEEVDAAGRHVAHACLEFGLQQAARAPTRGQRVLDMVLTYLGVQRSQNRVCGRSAAFLGPFLLNPGPFGILRL